MLRSRALLTLTSCYAPRCFQAGHDLVYLDLVSVRPPKQKYLSRYLGTLVRTLRTWGCPPSWAGSNLFYEAYILLQNGVSRRITRADLAGENVG